MMNEDDDIQYFAGGATWDNEDKAQEFLDEKKWVIGWRDGDNPNAKQSYTVLRRVKKGDMLALKAMGGPKKVNILAIGEITDITNKDNGEIKINWTSKKSFSIDWPQGEGSGNWNGTFLEIIQTKTRYDIFRQPIKSAYLDTIKINSYHNLEGINLQNLKDRKEIFFLGENGNGKTLLLQAILISLTQNFIEYDDLSEKKITGTIIDAIKNGKLQYEAMDSYQNKYPLNENNYIYLQNIYAYGVRRGNNKLTEDEKYGFMTLFDTETSLIDPIEWLILTLTKELYCEKNKIIYTGVTTIDAIELLAQLFDGSENLQIKIFPDKVEFIEHEKPISFNQLSEGYKSVMTWVCDLLSRLAVTQPDIKPEKNSDGKMFLNYQGIVLVDEIDLHLHPKWANKIVNKLTTWFPQIQFFFTTHSPIVLLGASRDAVFYKVYKEDGVTKISKPLESISSLTANTILTSPLFGLEDAISDAFDVDKDDPNTEDHYWDGIIHKEISKRISKNAGVSEGDIIKLVNEELDKLEAGAKRDKN
jgi:predicted ATP-binding protein involved in virulence